MLTSDIIQNGYHRMVSTLVHADISITITSILSIMHCTTKWLSNSITLMNVIILWKLQLLLFLCLLVTESSGT